MKELDKLRARLNDRNMTKVHKELEGKVSYGQLSRFMRGDNDPKYRLVRALEEYLNNK